MWRLFIALELPEEVLRKIEGVQRQLQKAIPKTAARWVRPEGVHLTLKFLGDTPADQVEALTAAIRRAAEGIHPIALRAEGLGCFPNTRRPRNLWVGVKGDLDTLRALHHAIEQEMTPLGFEPERRRFDPHLTLARTARRATRDEQTLLGKLAEESEIAPVAEWQAHTVNLIRSHLKPSGAVYEQVADIPLITGANSA
jgi:2'-5' RNA ligase